MMTTQDNNEKMTKTFFLQYSLRHSKPLAQCGVMYAAYIFQKWRIHAQRFQKSLGVEKQSMMVFERAFVSLERH